MFGWATTVQTAEVKPRTVNNEGIRHPKLSRRLNPVPSGYRFSIRHLDDWYLKCGAFQMLDALFP